MKLASDLSSIILVAMHVQQYVRMIGSISLARWQSITSAEYTSLKEQTQVAHGIRIILGEVVAITNITSSMIYLVNVDQLQNNNIKTTTSHHQVKLIKARFARLGPGTTIQEVPSPQPTKPGPPPTNPPKRKKGSHYFWVNCLI